MRKISLESDQVIKLDGFYHGLKFNLEAVISACLATATNPNSDEKFDVELKLVIARAYISQRKCNKAEPICKTLLIKAKRLGSMHVINKQEKACIEKRVRQLQRDMMFVSPMLLEDESVEGAIPFLVQEISAIPADDCAWQCRAYAVLSKLYGKASQPVRAQEAFNKAVELLKNVQDKYELEKIERFLSNVTVQLRDYGVTVEFNNKKPTWLTTRKDPDNKPIDRYKSIVANRGSCSNNEYLLACNSLGHLYAENKEYELATQSFERVEPCLNGTFYYKCYVESQLAVGRIKEEINHDYIGAIQIYQKLLVSCTLFSEKTKIVNQLVVAHQAMDPAEGIEVGESLLKVWSPQEPGVLDYKLECGKVKLHMSLAVSYSFLVYSHHNENKSHSTWKEKCESHKTTAIKSAAKLYQAYSDDTEVCELYSAANSFHAKLCRDHYQQVACYRAALVASPARFYRLHGGEDRRNGCKLVTEAHKKPPASTPPAPHTLQRFGFYSLLAGESSDEEEEEEAFDRKKGSPPFCVEVARRN